MRKEVLEYLNEMVWRDYHLANTLYYYRMGRARYLHDKKMMVDLEQLHFELREYVGELLEGLEDEQR